VLYYALAATASYLQAAKHAVAIQLLPTNHLILDVDDKLQHLLRLAQATFTKGDHLCFHLFRQGECSLRRLFIIA
jgi:hypothetical protein